MERAEQEGLRKLLRISQDVKAETSDMLRTVFTKTGCVPWETEGAGKPARLQANTGSQGKTDVHIR